MLHTLGYCTNKIDLSVRKFLACLSFFASLAQVH